MPIVFDAEKRTIVIPQKSISVNNLDSDLQNRMRYMPIATYGVSKYGKCIYGANYAQYGSDVYGDCVYY